MIVGVPTEIKTAENRVGCTPAGAASLISHGHKVLIQTGAGLGSGFTDEEYEAVGANVLRTAADVYSASDMIYKVKEPLKPEYSLFKEGQILFTYLHLAPEPELTKVLVDKKVVAIAYET
ncbi:MAG TPA: alanine dehydrogenase, partial [Bacillota bacterium]|nr:alanine dehydrogenase [Bacillota bacterium]